MDLKKRIQPFLVPPGKEISLKKDYAPDFLPDDIKANKENADELLTEGVATLAEYQDKLYAQNIYGLLVILQAMDAAGKDGAVKHVMTGLNPQGVQVYSFKQPSAEELDHDFLWRSMKALPERGRIGIFNRSYYEEVLVVRVHPAILARQQIPPATIEDHIWKRRYEDINNFEVGAVVHRSRRPQVVRPPGRRRHHRRQAPGDQPAVPDHLRRAAPGAAQSEGAAGEREVAAPPRREYTSPQRRRQRQDG